MDVLIIGGTRFVGYLLTWRLLAGGHRVTLLHRGTGPDPFGGRVEHLLADRTTPDFARVLAGRRFDAAVDFAAYTGADARSVVETLGDGRVGHYVFISTGQVYLVRDGCPRPARETDYDGTVVPEPSDIRERAGWRYGVGKRAAEDVLAGAWAAQGFPSTRLRIPIVNGERDYERRLEEYLWRLLDGGLILLPDGGDVPMRHVYGDSVARAIAALLGDTKTFGQAFNLAQEETPTLAELLTLLADLLGAKPRLVPVPRERIEAAGIRPEDISPFSGRWMSFLDPAKAREELVFRHDPLPHYLDKIVTSFLNHPPAAPPEGYEHRAVEVELAGREPVPDLEAPKR